MQTQLAALAQSSVLQLREAIRRVTLVHAAAGQQRDEQDLLAGVEVTESTWHEWEETTIDVHQIKA
jgi:hypothetical protein